MAQPRDRNSAVISAVIGGAFATLVCFIFFYYFGNTAKPVDAQPTPTATAAPTTAPEMPVAEIKPADVSSVSINTVYTGYFQASDKCAKTYNEYFGNDDGIGSSSSPCTAKVTFDRDGKASRTVAVSRWDRTAKEKRLVENQDSTAIVTPEQFGRLVDAITSNPAFRSWRDGTMINVSNCSITVTYAGGSRSPMSNVSEKATDYLPMVLAFKELEKQLDWKAVK
ncbi:MAG: hypothetical protein ABJA02_08950 [Acidobacteriota bacterium]